MKLTEVERDALGLWVVCGALDSLINHALIKLVGKDEMKEVHFQTSTHQQLFSILLQDFNEDARALTGIQGSCLDVLLEACHIASFDQEGSVECLKEPVEALRTWLKEGAPEIRTV